MSPQEIKIIFFLERQLNYQNIKSQVTKITRKRPEVTRSIPHNKKHPPRVSMTLDLCAFISKLHRKRCLVRFRLTLQ